MITSTEAKREIAKLVAKYESLPTRTLDRYNEENTKKDFILPLFHHLGWEVDNLAEVAAEEKASSGRVDYAFKLAGVSRFYVEVKPLREDLSNRTDWAKQAVTYAENKGVTWAILTNFKQLMLFNAEWDEPNLDRARFLNLTCHDYEPDFVKLWWLSRESIEKGILNEEARKVGALKPKLPVEKSLYNQLLKWRTDLFNQIFHYQKDKGLNLRQTDELIQQFVNRLVFIRNVEDRGIEENRLRAALHQWRSGGREGDLVERIRDIFHNFASVYDSDLFPLSDAWDSVFVESATIEGIIDGLYERPTRLAGYDFAAIDADVLGAVYEQYLGYVAQEAQAQAKKEAAQARLLGFEEPVFELGAKRLKRKQQGIYYTPKFVVDYIVRETVGRFIEERNYNEVVNLKVLDPACGSGSFLIRAYDELLNYHAYQQGKVSAELDQWERLPILTANIFGVDLDRQAVEIARLNLLLRSLSRQETLPSLANNIRQGNSLISGSEDQLRSYFGDNWQEIKPFNWDTEFNDTMANGGFDVVIGNPPYQSYYSRFSQKVDKAHTDYYVSTYDFLQGVGGVPRISSIMLFIDRAAQWVKHGGRIAFVLDQELLDVAAYGRIRKYILDKCFIDAIVAKARFPEINLDTCIIVLRKKKPGEEDDEHATRWVDDIEQPDKFVLLSQEKFRKHTNFEFTCSLYEGILSKIEAVSRPLGKVSLIRTGMCITREDFYSDEQVNNKWHPGLFGSNVERYFLEWPSSDQAKHTRGRKKFLCFDKSLEAEVNRRLASQGSKTVKVIGSEDRFTRPKLLVRQGPSQPRIEAAYDDAQYYAHQTLHIVNEKQTSLKFLLAILNSQLMGFYAREVRAIKYGPKKPPQIRTKGLATLPIRRIDLGNPTDKKRHDDLVALVDKMLELHRQLAPIRNTACSEREDVLRQIKQTDQEIDNLVYDLYGLTDKEKRIVEGTTRSQK
jgi:type I restriction-modification system DNA methylase subunit